MIQVRLTALAPTWVSRPPQKLLESYPVETLYTFVFIPYHNATRNTWTRSTLACACTRRHDVIILRQSLPTRREKKKKKMQNSVTHRALQHCTEVHCDYTPRECILRVYRYPAKVRSKPKQRQLGRQLSSFKA